MSLDVGINGRFPFTSSYTFWFISCFLNQMYITYVYRTDKNGQISILPKHRAFQNDFESCHITLYCIKSFS